MGSLNLGIDDIKLLKQISTTDDQGNHFTSIYGAEWLFHMEKIGCISIERPLISPENGEGPKCRLEDWKVRLTAKGLSATNLPKAISVMH
jgi:hypothetical protein